MKYLKYNNGSDYSYNTGCMQERMHEQPDLVELWTMPAENGLFKEIRTLAPPKSRSASRTAVVRIDVFHLGNESIF